MPDPAFLNYSRWVFLLIHILRDHHMLSVMNEKKRRSNIIYKLRKKGVMVDLRSRTIELPYGRDPNEIIQVVRLRREYRFNVQYYIS